MYYVASEVCVICKAFLLQLYVISPSLGIYSFNCMYIYDKFPHSCCIFKVVSPHLDLNCHLLHNILPISDNALTDSAFLSSSHIHNIGRGEWQSEREVRDKKASIYIRC